MEAEDSQQGDTQATQQATQDVLDPRRIGQQNSGFSDEDIADIICLLVPYSEAARAELREMSLRTKKHMVEADDAAHPDLQSPDGVKHMPQLVGEHAIVLRLSAETKDPLNGFAFGRNASRCDIYFSNDPLKRLSNIHFRIYLNEYGVLMLEDSSMNGTVVDGTVLKAKEKEKGNRQAQARRKQTLNAGSQVKILMAESEDDLLFLVQIPRREGKSEEAYRRNLSKHMRHIKELRAEHEDAGKTITAGPGGHLDLFPPNEPTRRTTPRAARRVQLPDDPTQEALENLPKEWKGSDRYNRVSRIGKGAFATVYKVTAKFDGQPYAAKELDKRKFMKNGVLDQKVENEMKIMRKAKHPNIVEYIDHFDWDNRLLIIIMELVPNGDLGSLISGNGALREGIVQEMSSQLLSALAYLHANNITHRDVKPDNILVQSYSPFIVKLTDFGLSKMVETEQTFLKTFCGTLLYCAPEVYNEFTEYDENGRRNPRNRRRRLVGQRYDHAIDIWSLGGVLYYTLTAQPPFPAKNGISYTELLHTIMTRPLNLGPLREMEISEDGMDFVSWMLQRRPEQRAMIEELRSHPWLQEFPFSQEKPASTHPETEEIDNELGREASQLSLDDKNAHNVRLAEINEVQEDQDLADAYEADDNESRDFDLYDSHKENYTFDQKSRQPPKLFGEVSALNSAGAVPSDRLNLPVPEEGSVDGTQIFNPEIKDSYGSEDSTPRQARRSQPTPRAAIPPALTQSRRSASRSVTELNNMVFDAEMQDLGGAECQLENLNMKSLAPSIAPSTPGSFATSIKRKPANDTSDEFDSTPRARPPVKKLRSESTVNMQNANGEADQNLCSWVPALSRINSNRQIDKPVHKSAYWDARDRRTWHLHYPEMTQLQHDAFVSAARSRGEVFAPGKSPLWGLAMKHFPPESSVSVLGYTRQLGSTSSTSDAESKASGRTSRSDSVTARSPAVQDDMPDTLPPASNSIAQAYMDPPLPLNRTVATLESVEGSAMSGISIIINQSMVSWGRGTDNTHIFTPSTEPKVPKYALKIMLWKEGYEPFKNFRPWNRKSDDYYFYISTKASHGIQVNHTTLMSHEPRNPRGESKNWIRLHDGDKVTFWNAGSGPDYAKARLTFRCYWGGSARPRDASNWIAETVPAELAASLDASCLKAEERTGKLAEYDLRLQEADLDASERQTNIERERLRSQKFETYRLETCRVMAMRASSASRRTSPAAPSPMLMPPPPASAPPGSNGMARHRSVPMLKHSASGGLEGRTLQSMAEK